MKNINRLWSCLLVIAMLIGSLPAWAADYPTSVLQDKPADFLSTGEVATVPTLEVVTATTSAAAGDVIDFEVWLRDADKLADGVWNVTFTLSIPKGLKLVPDSGSVEANFASVTGFMMPTFTESSLVFTSLGALMSGYTGEDVPCLSFQCTVLDTASAGKVAVSVVNTDLSDGYASIVANVVPATITVAGGENAGILGDVNGDNQVNLGDVQLLFMFTRGKAELTDAGLSVSDVNKDNQINLGDVQLLFMFTRGKAELG